MSAGGVPPGWADCQIRHALSMLAWWAKNRGSKAAQSSCPMVPPTHTWTLSCRIQISRLKSVKLSAFMALAHSCANGGAGDYRTSPGDRAVSVGQPDWCWAPNTSMGAFARMLSPPSACATEYGPGMAAAVDVSHHGKVTPGTCDCRASSSQYR